MGPHTTLTPKISKISIHLGDMEVPLSTNFLIKTVFYEWFLKV